MKVYITYKDDDKECFFMCAGKDIEVNMLTDKGLDIRQIPGEEYSSGFRAKERTDD